MAALDGHLRTQAGQDAKRRVAACFVAIDPAAGAIAGFYTLSACHLRLDDIAPDLRRRLPRYAVVPAVRLGRLAIDLRHQGNKLGRALMANAVARALRSDIAAHLLVVEAKDDAAAGFYLHHGFRADPEDRRHLYAPLSLLGKVLGLP